jgi:hypothetical protein
VRTGFVSFAQKIVDRCRPNASYEADYDDAVEMIDAAMMLRSQGLRVRCSVAARRLYVTVPWGRDLRMRLAKAWSDR